ncbi:TolC family protein [Leptospira stimsonii]|uniref:TolC family protein n=1 Tax=Leptospira stimsonii TaxID=2202203 RepID=UPI001F4EB96A|nr:TolC family protein [Leptospira stimsonii]
MKFYVVIFISAMLFSFTFEIHTKEKGKENLLRLNLEKAILIGITNNIFIKNIERQNEVLELTLNEKWREYLPKLGISYFGLRNLNQNQVDSVYNDIRLTVQQLLYDGGENFKNIEIAKLSAELNKAEFKIQVRKIKIEIVRQYMKVLATRGKLLTSKRLYKSFKNQLNDIISEYRNGLKARIDVLEIEQKLNEAQLGLIKAEKDHKAAVIELKLFLQLEETDEVEINENVFYDYILSDPFPILNKDESDLEHNRPDLKKTKIVVDKLKVEKDIAEDYWKPKFLIGGYAGKNSNDTNPVNHYNYGFNFSIVLPLGSSTFQTQSNYGVQTDGTGIQRIPGYGPQFVGQGENTFNSANLQLFDNLSQSRKILEGELKLNDAVAAYNIAKKQAAFEVVKSKDKLTENFSVIYAVSRKVILSLENYKITKSKFKSGLIKRTESLKAEYELSKAQDELADSYAEYLRSCYEYFNASGRDLVDLPFYNIAKGKGNSIVSQLIKENRENLDLFPERGY